MKQSCMMTMLSLGFVLVSCDSTNATGTGHESSALPRTQSAANTTSDGLPPPKPIVTLQEKYMRVIPLKNGSKPAYEIVSQWVFQPSEDDNSIICVGDGQHCVTLLKLKEQLTRPAN